MRRTLVLIAAVVAVLAATMSWRPAAADAPYPPVPNDYNEASRISRLYSSYFLRPAEPFGLFGWTNALVTRQLTLEQVSDRFATSAEFQAHYGSLSNREFVRRLYINILGREPEPFGWDGWTGTLDGRVLTRGQLMVKFAESDEYRARVSSLTYCSQWVPIPNSDDQPSQIARLYASYFLRQFDGPGFYGWTSALVNRQLTLEQISDRFATSAEFQARYGTLSNREFVRRLYVNILGREPEAAGLDGWTGALDGRALTRGQLMVRFSESFEYRTGRALNPPSGCWNLPADAQVPKPPPAVFPASLSIPVIGVSAQIQGGLSDPELFRGPGWTPGTAYPGVTGNMVLFGHRTECSPYPKCGIFRNLHLLRPGHQMTVNMNGRVQTYQVVDLNPADRFNGFTVVGENDLWPYIASAANQDWLTLIACSRTDGLPTDLRYRIVVRAVRVA